MRAFHTHRIRLDAALDQLGALLHADARLFAGVVGLAAVFGAEVFWEVTIPKFTGVCPRPVPADRPRRRGGVRGWTR